MAAAGVSRTVRGLSVAVLGFGIAGCDQSDSDQAANSDQVSGFSQSNQKSRAAAAAPAALRQEIAGDAANPAQQKRVAVSHMYALRMPNRDVERVQQAHLQDCVKLGCEV